MAIAIAQKVAVVETASDFLGCRAGKAKPADMLPFPDGARRDIPPAGTRYRIAID